eukprot:CCRYP_000984-RA/>CCRYP_000984-RA protein AED:0.37 eAED:0.21 QI:0/0/0/1/0/0/3/0/1009
MPSSPTKRPKKPSAYCLVSHPDPMPSTFERSPHSWNNASKKSHAHKHRNTDSPAWSCQSKFTLCALRYHGPSGLTPGTIPPPQTRPSSNETSRPSTTPNRVVFDSQENVRRAINDALNEAIPNAFRKPIGNQMGQKVYTVRDNPRDILSNLERSAAQALQPKRRNNVLLGAPWDPNDPIEALFDRTEDCFIFALICKPQFTMEQIIDKAIVAIQLTGLYETALLEWSGFAEENKTWQQLKLHFEEAYELRLASGQGTAGTHGYVNSATANGGDSIASIQESIVNFHMANNANYQSMQDILQAARAETASLRAELQSTQQSFANFARATPPAFVPPIPQYVPALPPGQQQFTPTPAMPYQQYQQGGRGARSRGGKGRNTRNRRGQTQQYYTPTTPATTFNIPSSTLGVPPPAFQPPSTPPNPVKYYNNWNMCFSCGFDVEGWHTSATCRNKKQGHQDGCTRENAQAYKDAGHKVAWRARTKLHCLITNNCEFISSSTPTTNYTNYYAALQCEDTDDEDEATVVASNVSYHQATIHPTATATTPSTCQPTRAPSNKCPQATQDPATQLITTRHQHYAIFDSGATAHFLVSTAHVVNKRPALKPLTIRLPNGKNIVSTHTCNLDLPWLPHSITEAHIVPGLSHSSLISTRKFCDAGCQVTLDQQSCKIYYQGALVLTGTRDETTGLWKVPIHPHQPPHPGQHSKPSSPHATHCCLSYSLKRVHSTVQTTTTQVYAPGILQPTNSNTPQGHQQQPTPRIPPHEERPGTPKPRDFQGPYEAAPHRHSSTRSPLHETLTTPVAIPTDIPNDEPPIVTMPCPHVIPPDITDTTCNVFCFAALADKHQGTMYTDATGALPAVTLEGNQYYLVAYAYDPNYIYAVPLRNLRDESIMTAFEHVFQDLKTKGYKPTFNVTDNQATTPIKSYLNTEDCKWQFVEPHNHRVNASGACHPNFQEPLHQWIVFHRQQLAAPTMGHHDRAGHHNTKSPPYLRASTPPNPPTTNYTATDITGTPTH